MSQQITTAFVEQYRANVQLLSQQRGSVLRPAVRFETVVGKNAAFEQISKTVAQKKTTRHGPTPQIDTPHARRWVTPVPFEWADLIDDADRVRMLINPESSYAQNAMWGMGRALDDEIISAAFGTSNVGENFGDSTVAFSTTVLASGGAVIPHDATSTGAVGGVSTQLTVDKLRLARQFFANNDVDKSIRKFIACTPDQITGLLREEEITSSDFNIIRALVRGDINSFMGFEFIESTRITQSTNNDLDGNTDVEEVIAWAQDGLLLGVGQDMTARVGERADLSYSTQVFVSQDLGSTRMDEDKVLKIECTF